MAAVPKPSTSAASPPLPVYEPKSAVQASAIAALQGGGLGILVSAVQNALGNHTAGAAGVFTRTGGTIGFLAAMGGTFAFTDAVSANVREKDDAVNGALGGCAAGFLYGIRQRSLPTAFATCAVLGTVMGGFDAAGRSLIGEDTSRMTMEQKEERRRKFFKPPKPSTPKDEEATSSE